MRTSLAPCESSPLSSLKKSWHSPLNKLFLKPQLELAVWQLPETASAVTWRVMASEAEWQSDQKGEELSEIIGFSMSPRFMAWHEMSVPSRKKLKGIHTSLYLPDEGFNTFRVPCMAAWNAKDIEAECWLEASSRLECPVSQLAMDYEVRIADDQQLMAEVLVCQLDVVRRSVLLFSSIGLNIDVISNQSRRPAHAGL
jgi:hypothetical protein